MQRKKKKKQEDHVAKQEKSEQQDMHNQLFSKKGRMEVSPSEGEGRTTQLLSSGS